MLEYIKQSSIPVPESGCWIWEGKTNYQGYGRCPESWGSRMAHRAAWMAVHGAITDGLFVCHHCDVKGCVNPDHLFIGTCKDNLHDASRKGRMNHSPQWIEEHRKKLTGRKRGTYSEEHRAKISAATIGRIPWNKGMKLSDDQKSSMKGKPKSVEHRAKLSLALKGRVPWNKKS